jgi:DNA transformation protein
MPVSKGFVAHALDLLALAGPVQARAMFGGYGLYLRGAMFGLLDDDELFLKADDESRSAFTEAGCRPWTYPGPKGPTAGPYWRPPDAAHEDPESMLPWARLAVGAAERARARKAAKGRRAATSRRRSASSAAPAPKGRVARVPAGKPRPAAKARRPAGRPRSR